jgi:hypothetical protein
MDVLVSFTPGQSGAGAIQSVGGEKGRRRMQVREGGGAPPPRPPPTARPGGGVRGEGKGKKSC